MNKIEQTFENLHPSSKQLAKDARNVFPMGVTHVSRSMSPYPIYMVEGKGPKKWDVDGNEYIDYRTGHGSMILGQAHPAIVKAVKDQVEKGTHFSSGTNLEIRWAECVKTLVPSVEKMRFVSSGTEALMMAFKMARVFTGREKIVKFSVKLVKFSRFPDFFLFANILFFLLFFLCCSFLLMTLVLVSVNDVTSCSLSLMRTLAASTSVTSYPQLPAHP